MHLRRNPSYSILNVEENFGIKNPGIKNPAVGALIVVISEKYKRILCMRCVRVQSKVLSHHRHATVNEDLHTAFEMRNVRE